MSDNEISMSASEFKAKCLGVFDKLAGRKLKRVTITKRGKPVAVLTPPPVGRDSAETIFGFMRGRVIAPKGYDFTKPAYGKRWDAEKGKL
jgi:prevent-host-death family protein